MDYAHLRDIGLQPFPTVAYTLEAPHGVSAGPAVSSVGERLGGNEVREEPSVYEEQSVPQNPEQQPPSTPPHPDVLPDAAPAPGTAPPPMNAAEEDAPRELWAEELARVLAADPARP